MSPFDGSRIALDRHRVLRELVAALLSLAAVALVSGAIFALEPVAPVLSLGVLYLFAVLPVAAIWGLPFAVPVSIVSMLAFNWLFLEPRHTFRLADSENWVALAVYLVTAISVSELAVRARRRTAEAEERGREAERAMTEARASEDRRLREAVEAEALRRSDAAKTAVLRSVSHDLRSPITAIMTASEVLLASGSTLSEEDRAELLGAIRLQLRRLERLVANLLELSRLEAGAATPERELWTIDGLVARTLDAIGPDNDRIDVELPADAPPIEVDPTQIERALVNLLENALKVSPPAEHVSLRAEFANDEIVIRVVDRGPGVPLNERERIFEPFVRGADADGGRGSGLGLAIARGFVGVNGGRLWLESSPGPGAAFAIALPVAASPASVPLATGAR